MELIIQGFIIKSWEGVVVKGESSFQFQETVALVPVRQ